MPKAEGAGLLLEGSVVSSPRLRLRRRPPPRYTPCTLHPAPDALCYPSASLQPARGPGLRVPPAAAPPPPPVCAGSRRRRRLFIN